MERREAGGRPAGRKGLFAHAEERRREDTGVERRRVHLTEGIAPDGNDGPSVSAATTAPPMPMPLPMTPSPVTTSPPSMPSRRCHYRRRDKYHTDGLHQIVDHTCHCPVNPFMLNLTTNIIVSPCQLQIPPICIPTPPQRVSLPTILPFTTSPSPPRLRPIRFQSFQSRRFRPHRNLVLRCLRGVQ